MVGCAAVAFALGVLRVMRQPAAVVARVDVQGTLQDGTALVEAFDAVARAPRVKAVLVRINSPGGDVAAAQDVLGAVKRVRAADKPVVAAIGSVGASGGYYIALGAQEIWAEPGSLTGSIGVIYERLDVSGLAGRLGIARDALTAGSHKDAGSMWRKPTVTETTMMRGLLDDVYRQFLDAVQEARGLEEAAVLRAADGRVWTGRQARDLGLVDRLGSWREAGERAAVLAGLSADTPIEEWEMGAWTEQLAKRWLGSLVHGMPTGWAAPAGVQWRWPG
jgi:protease-4